jgi:hypothetical protein
MIAEEIIAEESIASTSTYALQMQKRISFHYFLLCFKQLIGKLFELGSSSSPYYATRCGMC